MKSLLYASFLIFISNPAFSSSNKDLHVPLFLDGVFQNGNEEKEINIDVLETGLSINCRDQKSSGWLGLITLSSHIVDYKSYFEPAFSLSFDNEQQFMVGHYNFINEEDSHFSCNHGIKLDFQYTNPNTQETVAAYTYIEFSGNIFPKTEFNKIKGLQNKVITIRCESIQRPYEEEPQHCLSEIQ